MSSPTCGTPSLVCSTWMKLPDGEYEDSSISSTYLPSEFADTDMATAFLGGSASKMAMPSFVRISSRTILMSWNSSSRNTTSTRGGP